jgi:hypothetical protein
LKKNRRQRYQDKRLKKNYKKKRAKRITGWKSNVDYKFTSQRNLPIINNLIAPSKFSFLENTDEILEYLRSAKAFLKNKEAVRFDISKIEYISPDTIPLLIAHIRNPKFNCGTPIHGNAPDDSSFKEMFTKSGFYKYVKSIGSHETAKNNIMHNESKFKVVPDIAGSIVEIVTENCNYNDVQTEAIYNVLIEMMSNTYHHADLKKYGHSRWWLHMYSDTKCDNISLSFFDLGVGIFKSIVVQSFIQKLGLNIKILGNKVLVQDLLEGKIQSRIEADGKIRGKGLPQIVENSKLSCFSQFHLISNNIKIDLKSNSSIELNESLSGTFYYIKFEKQE